MNHNVRMCLILCVFSGIADSTWSGTVIAAFIFISAGNNTTVGLVEAAQGLATLIFALPIGFLADKFGRSGIISVGGALCLVAAVATTWIILDVERNESLSPHATAFLFVTMCAWGIVGGIMSGPAQALYADSIPTGERSKWYVYLFAAYIVSSAVGPLVAVTVFSATRDTWTLPELRFVILLGMAFEAACAVTMCLFKDSEALGEQAEARGLGDNGPAGVRGGAAAAAPAEEAEVPEEEAAEAAATPGAADAPATASPAADAAPAALVAAPAITAPAAAAAAANPRDRGATGFIPYILFAASMLMSLGSGMTVKFFPLFFKEDCRLTPTQVQLTYVAVPFAMVACSAAIQRLSLRLGRVQCVVLSKTAGVSLLCLLAWLELRSSARGAAVLVIPIYVLRTALMNSGYPLEESILMDFVPKSSRARWKSLESISQFGWCGSAALGGWLGDRFGYSFTFLITAAVQGTGTLVFATLLPVVPRKEAVEGGGADAATPVHRRGAKRRATATGVRADLTEPLIDQTADNGAVEEAVVAHPDSSGGRE